MEARFNWKFTKLNGYIKEDRSTISCLNLDDKKVKQEKEEINISTEVNGKESKSINRSQQKQMCFSEKINKTNEVSFKGGAY